MTCHEFTKQIEGLSLAELSSAGDAELLMHQNSCSSCAALLQQQNALAGAMQALRSRTGSMQAPSVVEQNVLRAFRQNTAVQPAPVLAMKSQSARFQAERLCGMESLRRSCRCVGNRSRSWLVVRATLHCPAADGENRATRTAERKTGGSEHAVAGASFGFKY